MSIVFKAFLFLCVFLQLNTREVVSEPNTTNSPNFIVILVDDQGWNGTSVQMLEKKIL